MPIKKTVQKKADTKPVAKATTKSAKSVEIAETKKPTVVVETKKVASCDDKKCGCCPCGCILKTLILLLLIANIVLTCINVKKTDSRGLELLKIGWQENMTKVEELYKSDVYITTQKQSIDDYLSSLWISE